MSVLAATRCNPVINAFYQRLCAEDKACFWQVKMVPVPAIEKGTTRGKKYITNLYSFVSSLNSL
jgi:hypothetical protein